MQRARQCNPVPQSLRHTVALQALVHGHVRDVRRHARTPEMRGQSGEEARALRARDASHMRRHAGTSVRQAVQSHATVQPSVPRRVRALRQGQRPHEMLAER